MEIPSVFEITFLEISLLSRKKTSISLCILKVEKQNQSQQHRDFNWIIWPSVCLSHDPAPTRPPFCSGNLLMLLSFRAFWGRRREKALSFTLITEIEIVLYCFGITVNAYRGSMYRMLVISDFCLRLKRSFSFPHYWRQIKINVSCRLEFCCFVSSWHGNLICRFTAHLSSVYWCNFSN